MNSRKLQSEVEALRERLRVLGNETRRTAIETEITEQTLTELRKALEKHLPAEHPQAG